MKEVKIKYFAILKEQARIENEVIKVPCETYSDLYNFLKNKYNFSLPVDYIQVAVNHEFKDMNHLINEGDNVVFIPPVAGG